MSCCHLHHTCDSYTQVTCIVANEPYLSGDGNIGKAVRERGVGKVARLLGAALLDKVSKAVRTMP